MSVYSNIVEAERGGLIDLGKALRYLLSFGGSGGGPAITAASISDFRFGTDETKYISPAVFFTGNAAYTLTDSITGNITVNMNNGLNFLLTLGGNRTMLNPENYKIGQRGVIVVQQDATGGRTLSWDTFWKFEGSTPVIPTAAHAWTLFSYFVQATDVIRVWNESSSNAALNVATVQEIREGLETLKYVSPAGLIGSEAPVALVEADPVLIDLGEGKNFKLTLSADRTMDSPLDQMPGRNGTISVTQNGTGGWTLGWHADWIFTQGTPTLLSEPSATTVFHYNVDSVTRVIVTRDPQPASVTEFFTGTSTGKFISPYSIFEGHGFIAIADGPTPTPNFATGLNFTLTLGGNRTMANPINQKKQSGIFYIKQDGTGDRTLAWDTNYQFLGGILPVIPTAPNAWTVVPYQVLTPGTIICSAIETTAAGGGGASVEAASSAETKSGLLNTKYVSPLALTSFYSPVVLADAASITPDMAAGSTFVVTLGGNRTMENIANQKPGRNGTFIVIQDATGGRTLTWGNNYTFLGGTPILPTGPGEWIIIPYTIEDFGIIRGIHIQTFAAISSASVAEVRAGVVANKYIAPSVAIAANAFVNLVDGATISLDLSTGINFKVIIAGNRSLANPTNQIAGKQGIIKVQQDAVGGRTLSWGSEYIFETVAPTVPTDPNKHLVVPYTVESPGVVLIGN